MSHHILHVSQGRIRQKYFWGGMPSDPPKKVSYICMYVNFVVPKKSPSPQKILYDETLIYSVHVYQSYNMYVHLLWWLRWYTRDVLVSSTRPLCYTVYMSTKATICTYIYCGGSVGTHVMCWFVSLPSWELSSFHTFVSHVA